MFGITGNTGQIYTLAGAQRYLNFEDSNLNVLTGTGRGFTITVRATSFGPPSDYTEQQYQIYIVEVNLPPYMTAVPSWFVIETSPIGVPCDPVNSSSIYLTASDPNNEVTLLKGQPAPVQYVTFSRDLNASNFDPLLNDSGKLFNVFMISNGVGAIQTGGLINYATAPIGGLECGLSDVTTRCYRIRLIATDNGPPPNTPVYSWVIIIVVEVDPGPSFSTTSQTVSISEGITSSYQLVGGPYAAQSRNISSLVFSVVSSPPYFNVVQGKFCRGE